MIESSLDVLVVDDDPVAREYLAHTLQEAGYKVREAGDGWEALSLIRSTPFRVVLTDLQMPRMNGLRLFEYLLAGWPGIATIFMSAGSADLAGSILARGASAWIKKPFDERIVLEAVHAAIHGVRGVVTHSEIVDRPGCGLF